MSKHRVLVYDDDAVAIGGLLVLVTLMGHEAVGTLHVSEGAEAMDLAPFDLLLARHSLPGCDLAIIANSKRPAVQVAFIAGEDAGLDNASNEYLVLREPYTRQQVETLLSRSFAIHAVRVAASTYIQAVRTACLAPGTSASTEALVAASEHIQVLRSQIRAVTSGAADENE